MWEQIDNSNNRGDWNHFKITQTRRTALYPRPVHVRFVVHKVALGQVCLPVLLFSPVSIIPPVLHTHLPSTCCSYQKDKREKPGNLPRSNDLSENGKHWIEKYFHLVFKLLNTGNSRLYLSHDTGHAPEPRLTWQKKNKKEQSEKKKRLSHNSGLEEGTFLNWARQRSESRANVPTATEFYVPQNVSPFL